MLAAALGALLAGCSGSTGSPPTEGHPTPNPIASTARPTRSSASSASAPAVSSAATATAPTASGATGDAVGKRIGLVAPTGSDPFGKAVTDSVVAQLQAAGALLLSCDPGDDPTLVLRCARRLATEQVDGWIAVQPGNLGQALCDAGPHDVPLITVAASPLPCQSAGVGTDDRQAGFLVGEHLGATPRNRSACAQAVVLIFTDEAAGAVNTERVAGIESGFDTRCPGKIDGARVLDAPTQDRAYDAFTAALAGVPAGTDVLVASVTDTAALGVAAAIPDDRSAHVSLAAVGADERARCQIVADRGWIGDAALFPDRYGRVAVPALLDALHGRRLAPMLTVPTVFLTATTMAGAYDVGDCPAR